jgi:hypothetical protein
VGERPSAGTKKVDDQAMKQGKKGSWVEKYFLAEGAP